MSTFEMRKPAGVKCQRSPSATAQPERTNVSSCCAMPEKSLRYRRAYSARDTPCPVRMPSLRYSAARSKSPMVSYSSIMSSPWRTPAM